MAMGAMSVSLMKPRVSSSFSGQPDSCASPWMVTSDRLRQREDRNDGANAADGARVGILEHGMGWDLVDGDCVVIHESKYCASYQKTLDGGCLCRSQCHTWPQGRAARDPFGGSRGGACTDSTRDGGRSHDGGPPPRST